MSETVSATQAASVTPTATAPATRVAAKIAAKTGRLDALLDTIAARHARVKFASSLAAEDMLLTHAILSRGVKIGIFSLNTGRLHAETLGMIARVRERYGYEIEQFHPRAHALDEYVRAHGPNAFYESVDLRQRCCEIRKVEPLERALAGVDAWVTGQRRAQSVTRAGLHEEERDDARGIAKFNPLADWNEDDVWTYLRAFDVPVNPLHARGYPSIGCEPCTRAVRPGEDSRAGRWWWETRDTKECGLHPTGGFVALPVTSGASAVLAASGVPDASDISDVLAVSDVSVASVVPVASDVPDVSVAPVASAADATGALP